jgi:hypothetical protein
MSLHNNYAPIVVFPYDRLNCLVKTIEALKNNNLSRYSDLIIYSDGPKSDDKIPIIEKIRSYIKKIDGFSSIYITEREYNLGASNSIILGVTETVEKYGKIIVLEDDIITSPTFLDYMNTALEYYKYDNRVMHISSYFPYNKNLFLPDTFFLNVPCVWGWATWSRAWKFFHRNWQELFNKFTNDDINIFNINGKHTFFQDFILNKDNKMIWDSYWYACIYTNNGICLHTKNNKIINIGFDGSGETEATFKIPQIIVNDSKITYFTNIFEVNKYATFIYGNLIVKYFGSSKLIFILKRKIINCLIFLGFKETFLRKYYSNILNISKKIFRKLYFKFNKLKSCFNNKFNF